MCPALMRPIAASRMAGVVGPAASDDLGVVARPLRKVEISRIANPSRVANRYAAGATPAFSR